MVHLNSFCHFYGIQNRRQRKMNFENIFILPNIIGDRSRRRFGGIFIKIPKVTSARSFLMPRQGARPIRRTSLLQCWLALVMPQGEIFLHLPVVAMLPAPEQLRWQTSRQPSLIVQIQLTKCATRTTCPPITSPTMKLASQTWTHLKTM